MEETATPTQTPIDYQKIKALLPKFSGGQRAWIQTSAYSDIFYEVRYAGNLRDEPHRWVFEKLTDQSPPYVFKPNVDPETDIIISVDDLAKRLIFLNESDMWRYKLSKTESTLTYQKGKMVEAILKETQMKPPVHQPPATTPVPRTPWKEARAKEAKALIVRALRANFLSDIARQEGKTQAAIGFRVKTALDFLRRTDPAWQDLPKNAGYSLLRKSKSEYLKRLTQ